jgi:predicted MPP superfamily phosphohydrolase
MRYKKAKTVLFIMFILLAVIGVTAYVSNQFILVSEYELVYSKLPASFDGYRILQLSDLHSKEFDDGNDKLLKKIRGQNPDMIVLTGDMVNSTDLDFSVFLSLASDLSAGYEIYYIVGNHEQSLSDSSLKHLHSKLEEMGVQILDNERAVINRDNDSIDLYGLWFNLRYYSDRSNDYVKNDAETYYFSVDKIKKVIGENDGSRFSILLAHNPLYADTYFKWGADLTFSGHVHGGMIRLPFLGGIYSPERTFFPEYDGGLYTFGEQNLIVSRGIGNGNLGFRFLNCPEIVTVTLKKAAE